MPLWAFEKGRTKSKISKKKWITNTELHYHKAHRDIKGASHTQNVKMWPPSPFNRVPFRVSSGIRMDSNFNKTACSHAFLYNQKHFSYMYTAKQCVRCSVVLWLQVKHELNQQAIKHPYLEIPLCSPVPHLYRVNSLKKTIGFQWPALQQQVRAISGIHRLLR